MIIILLIYFLFLNDVSAQSIDYKSLESIYEGAVKSWFDGRISNAISDFEYVVYNSTDDELTLKAGRDLVVLLNEKNENSLAIAYIDKLKAINPKDPYLEFEKAWALLSLNKYKEASDCIDNLFSLTTDEDIIYFARFIKSIIEMNLSGFENAIDELQSVYKKYPPLLSPSAYLIGEMYNKIGKKSIALNFFKDSLRYDSSSIQSLIDLAHIYEDSSYYLPAWQSFYTIRELDYSSPYFIKKADKLLKKIDKNPDEIFYWSRLGWPVHNKPLENRMSKDPVKISLYSDVNHNPSFVRRFYFISNVDFDVYDSVLGKVFSGKNNMQYSVEYVKSNRIFELRDNTKAKLYSTRNNFQIVLKDKNGILLIKTPEISQENYGVNRSDKEISTKLEVIVSTSGMNLFNYTYIDHIIPSIVSNIKGPKETYELIKALTILTRTYLIGKINSSKDFVFSDSDENFPFKGLQYEKQEYINALKDTEGYLLVDSKGDPYEVSYSLNAAGKTKSYVDDNSSMPDKLSPFKLFRWISFDFFKKQPYSIPQDQTQLSEINWLVILKPEWIEERINEEYKIGKIKNIYILKRDNFAIAESIKIEGSSGDIEIRGDREISRILSASTLRSNLFYIRAVMKGRFPSFFILKGVGSGDFKGMCIYGANYLSKNMGYNYTQLLRHYFPDAYIKKK